MPSKAMSSVDIHSQKSEQTIFDRLYDYKGTVSVIRTGHIEDVDVIGCIN